MFSEKQDEQRWDGRNCQRRKRDLQWRLLCSQAIYTWRLLFARNCVLKARKITYRYRICRYSMFTISLTLIVWLASSSSSFCVLKPLMLSNKTLYGPKLKMQPRGSHVCFKDSKTIWLNLQVFFWLSGTHCCSSNSLSLLSISCTRYVEQCVYPTPQGCWILVNQQTVGGLEINASREKTTVHRSAIEHRCGSILAAR